MILDTNVWSYVGEQRAARALAELEDDLAMTVIVPPSILLEALRTPVEELRSAIAGAMTARRRVREHPLPEARLEADELVAEARRLRPEWVRRFPMTSRLAPLEAYWTKRLWQQTARDPAYVAQIAKAIEPDTAERILEIQRSNQRAMRDANFRFHDEQPWSDFNSDAPADVTTGWGGDRIEAWRSESALLFWRELVHVVRRVRRFGGDKTYADWTEAWLDLDVIARDRLSWNRFWYYEVDSRNMPRCWMRAVMPWAQLDARVERGNPRDAQHAAYLFDADCFVTADRRYARALERVRSWSPRAFATVVLIPATDAVVDEIARAVSA